MYTFYTFRNTILHIAQIVKSWIQINQYHFLLSNINRFNEYNSTIIHVDDLTSSTKCIILI